MGFWSRLKARLFGPSATDAAERRAVDAFLAGSAAAPPVAPPTDAAPVRETYGVSADDPILCDQLVGERLYIATLRCPHGHRLGDPRRGSMAGKCTDPRHHAALFPSADADPAEACIVDAYELTCEGGEFPCTLYFDMYHPNPPPQPAPRGLSRA
ncbi:MAG: hypothetical protein FJ304_23830 [Planctomycetes bacterium]|nr:hypothetical protein [Planctomycetota bacterium]